nr:neoverrucotoxin subunit alpha-like [Misgurnus anguillicaudatus]
MSPMLRIITQCGLIKLKGAAAFLIHPVQSAHQDRVTLHYKTTTRLDTISPTLLHEGVSPSVINTTTATHVIIAVSYGAQAFFVFDNERINKEKNTEMENIIKKITSTFSAKDILSSLTDDEKSSSILYDCKLYTDVGDWKSSVSFDEAVEIYGSLPDLLGSKSERAVPLKVWLYPLKKLEKTSACAALSEVLMNKAENNLENLRKQIRMCEDMMTDYDNLSVMTWFPALKEKLKIFSKLLLGYQTEFQQKTADIIQTLNVSQEGQKSVQELISISDQSPFNPDNTQQWLETKDIQLVILNMCRAANISILKSQKELQHFIQNPQKSRVFCFTISPIDAEDSFLAAMKQHITLMKECTLTGADYMSPLQALKSDCISQKVVFDLQMFIAAKETNEEEEETKFIGASVPGDFNGHTVHFYYDGKIVSRNVKLDSNPDPATIMYVEETRVYIKLKHPMSKIPERYVVEYRVLADGINSNKWEHCVIVIDASALKEIYTVSHLKPNTQYQLRYMIIFKDYMSYVSGISTFKTCRLAPVPGQPFVNKLNTNTITLTWLKAQSDKYFPVLQYMVEYREAGLEGWSSVLTQGPLCECTLTVPHSTCYRVRVSAVYEDLISKPSEETSVPVDVWIINLSERKSSILLEVLKLQTEKKPVELIDWIDDESEVRGFIQCLPYISQLRFIKPPNNSSELWEKRKRLFILDLCLQAAVCQKETIETTVKMLLSSVNYEKCDFLLDLCSHVKDYESQTGSSVLPALQSIYQSSPAVWIINLSERKTSILLEVLKLQTEKKPVELIDWTDDESEVRGFIQCLPYISQLR